MNLHQMIKIYTTINEKDYFKDVKKYLFDYEI